MAQVALVASAFVAMMVFITFALRLELDLSVLVSGMLSVSIMSVGLLVAAVTQYYVGLGMRDTAIVLATGVFVLALCYEAVA